MDLGNDPAGAVPGTSGPSSTCSAIRLSSVIVGAAAADILASATGMLSSTEFACGHSIKARSARWLPSASHL